MRRLGAVLLIGWVYFVATPARAVDVESLVSPGALIAAHQREAKDCRSCHERFDRSAECERCLACHEPIAQDIENSLGLHGRLPGGSQNLCRSCHTEHKGADATIAPLVRDSFDHRRTDMPLEGAHATVACDGCHPGETAYREAPNACVDCHREHDAHAGSLGGDCGACHTPADWPTARFDHEATDFPLEGRHAQTDCALCHPQGRFEATPTNCADCHGIDDAHRGRLGPACGECHRPSGWKGENFDHGRQSGFALDGRHATLGCGGCHAGDPRAEKLDSSCFGCHAGDDDHGGRYGRDCGVCHDARSWARSRFDHAKSTSFALHGSHAKLDCELCHTGPVRESAMPSLCVDCHGGVDVHAGAEGSRCEKCHSETAWRDTQKFNHDLADFPLLGLHQLATCEDCHVAADFRETGGECVECHRDDDVHRKALGEDCARCHNPNGWARWSFDHDRQTDFVLNGAHRGIDCLACHRRPVSGEIELSMECRGCHLQDSPHSDAFGRSCERCHSESRWQDVRETR